MLPWQTLDVLPDTSVDQFHAYILRLNNENTAGKYRLAATKFENFCGQFRLPLNELPPGVLSLFSEVLVQQGLAPNSVSVMTAGAKKYLKWLQASGAIQPQTFMSPDLPRIKNGQPTSLRDDDLLDFFRWATRCPEPARTAIMLLPFCGLRSDELTHLMLSSIKSFDVPKSGGGTVAQLCFFVEKGKGGDPRTVPLLLDGRPILIRYLQGWRSHQFGEYLFPAEDGQPIANRTLRHYVQWIREQMAKAGRNPDKLTPHTLRRTYITTLWRAGLDVPTIIKISGHKNVQTTVRSYLDIQPQDVANTVNNKAVYLMDKSPYGDAVRRASTEVEQFLDSLKEEDDGDES